MLTYLNYSYQMITSVDGVKVRNWECNEYHVFDDEEKDFLIKYGRKLIKKAQRELNKDDFKDTNDPDCDE